MRHRVRGRKLGRSTAERKSLFRNQLASLVEHERIVTTLAKAKELRPIAERIVTKGRNDSVHSRRQVRRMLPNRQLVVKVFDDLGPRFADRPGGYLQIFKLGTRKGDAAEMAAIQFVDYEFGSVEESS